MQGEKLTYRSIDIEGEELEFSGGFTDLHTQSYQNILVGSGYGIEENRTAIATVSSMRGALLHSRDGCCAGASWGGAIHLSHFSAPTGLDFTLGKISKIDRN